MIPVRVRIERTYLTTNSGTRVVETRPDHVTVDSESLHSAIVEYIEKDGGRLLGTISETAQRAAATAWKNRVYLLSAEPAAD